MWRGGGLGPNSREVRRCSVQLHQARSVMLSIMRICGNILPCITFLFSVWLK